MSLELCHAHSLRLRHGFGLGLGQNVDVGLGLRLCRGQGFARLPGLPHGSRLETGPGALLFVISLVMFVCDVEHILLLLFDTTRPWPVILVMRCKSYRLFDSREPLRDNEDRSHSDQEWLSL